MKIFALKASYTNYNNFNKNNPNPKPLSINENRGDTFVSFGRIPVKNYISTIKNTKNPLNIFEKFSIEEYLKLSEDQLNNIRAQYNKVSENLNKDKVIGLNAFCNIIADCMKSTLDKSFGENNYIVVPIGRSLSAICKFLSYKIGEENVINIPLSNAHRFRCKETDFAEYIKTYKNIENDKGLKNFLNYLKKVKLSKSDIEKTDKQIVLTDYCCSGASLKGIKFLFQSDKVWGNQKNVHVIDVSKFTKVIEPEIINIPYLHSKSQDASYGICDLERILFQWFFNGSFKRFSLISHCTALANTAKCSKNYNLDTNERLLLFKLLDDFMTGKKAVKFIPKLKEKKETPYSKYQKIHFWNNKDQQLNDDKYDDIIRINNILIKTLRLEETGRLDPNFSTRIIKNLTAVKDKYFNNSETTQYNSEKYYKARNKLHEYLNNAEQQISKS